MRVYELAKEYDIKSTEFVNIVQQAGVDVKSHLSTLDDSEVAIIRQVVSISKEETIIEDVVEDTFVEEEANPVLKGVVEDTPPVEEEASPAQEDVYKRMREESAEENRLARERRAAESTKKLRNLKTEQYVKLDRPGFWGWLKSLFSTDNF